MHNNLLVLQSDFGLVDGAVSAMIGVALEESPTRSEERRVGKECRL